MRVILTGGGSAGHVNPALAIANIIKLNDPTSEIIFVGTSKGLENDLVPKAGYELRHVEISGIARSLSPSNIKTAIRVLTSPSKAKKLLKEFKPDIVIGTGGYACWPSLVAASKMGIPTVLHEANATPGVAVKQLCGKMDVVMTNFSETAEKLSGKQRAMHVGMPMRGEFENISRSDARKKLGISEDKTVILSFGGSLGAPMVNRAALEVMEKFSSVSADVVHFHSSGSREYDNMMAEYAEKNIGDCKNIELLPYIYDMSLKMAAADIVICRAGAVTLAELARTRATAILIPSPNVTDNHQYKNAKVLSDAGAAIIIEEKEFDGNIVSDTVKRLASDGEKRRAMSESIGKFYDMETGKKMFCEINALVSRYKEKKQ